MCKQSKHLLPKIANHDRVQPPSPGISCRFDACPRGATPTVPRSRFPGVAAKTPVKAIGFAGYSGAGKTTLVERLIPVFRRQGQRVSVVKHAHHKFDVDHPGKDTWRHREAGAYEVVAASDRRLVVMREFAQPAELSVHQLIAELDRSVDWVFVEGFKHADLPKLEVWRPPQADQPPRPAHYTQDRFVVGVATSNPRQLPQPTSLPVFDLDDAEALAQWLIDSGERFAYNRDHHG